MIEENSSKILPLIPLRDIVVFPNMVAPLFVGRDKSVKALEDAMNNDKEIILVTQRDSAIDDPEYKDIYEVGTLGKNFTTFKIARRNCKSFDRGRQ